MGVSNVVLASFFNIFLAQGDVDIGIIVADPSHFADGDQDFLAGIPVTRFYDQVLDGPGLWINKKVNDFADHFIACFDFVARYFESAAEMGVVAEMSRLVGDSLF